MATATKPPQKPKPKTPAPPTTAARRTQTAKSMLDGLIDQYEAERVPPGLTSTTTPAGIAAHDPSAIVAKASKGKGKPKPPANDAAAKPLRVRNTVMLPLHLIVASPDNPRADWDEERLRQLGESLVAQGQLVPLQVLPCNDAGHYELIDGESRWRAAKLVGYSQDLRCEVVECSPQQAAELRLISSLERRSLNAIEEARGIKLLVERHGCTQRDLATRIKMSQGQIANRLRLLDLPEAWQALVISGEITATLARDLVPHLRHERLADLLLEEWRSGDDRHRWATELEWIAMRLVRAHGRPLWETDFYCHAQHGWRNSYVALGKLDEATRTALAPIETEPGKHWTLHVEMWDQLNAAAEAKHDAAEAKRLAKQAKQRADGAAPTLVTDARTGKQITTEERGEQILAQRIARWKLNWQCRRLAEWCRQRATMEQVTGLWLWMALEWSGGGDRRDVLSDVLKTNGVVIKSHRADAQWELTRSLLRLEPKLAAESLREAMARLLTHKECHIRSDVSPDLVEGLWAYLSCDTSSHWDLSGDDEHKAFFALLPLADLHAMALQRRVDRPSSRKSQIVEQLATHNGGLPCPKELIKVSSKDVRTW